MLRVGYPESLPLDLFDDFPAGIELVCIPDSPEQDIEVEVWIPDPYTNRALRAWPRLRGVRLVLSMNAGTEWIPPVVGPGVTVCSARGAHNVCTAEWAIAAILAMLKYFPLYSEIQREGRWKRRFEAPPHYAAISGDDSRHYPPVLLEELTGKSLLLVGYGAIGKEIERMLSPFKVNVTRIARTARPDEDVHGVSELDTLLPHAEIVILIVPATEDTQKLLGTRQFALMQHGTLVVNAARGPIIDTDALLDALRSGRIRAALDVTDPEPLPEGHPLWSAPNVMITPHIGASSPQFTPRALRTASAELRRYMSGEPLQNVVQAAI